MSLAGSTSSGPFRGLIPYDETLASLFFGRTEEIEALTNLLTHSTDRQVVLCGESGVGKTSLLRAGLMPRLAENGVTGIYLGNYEDLEQEIWQALGRVRAVPPNPSDRPADYLIRLARNSTAGTLLVLDHLETLLEAEDEGPPPTPRDQLAAFVSQTRVGAGDHLRVLLSIDASHFHRLHRLQGSAGLSANLIPFELGRLKEDHVTHILEQTVLSTGTLFEAGLTKAMATDLCRNGPCLPIDVQILAVTTFEDRLTSLRRYERAGGAAFLLDEYLPRLLKLAGGPGMSRVLEACARTGSYTQSEMATQTGLPLGRVEKAINIFQTHGLLRKVGPHAPNRYRLSHPSLIERIHAFTAPTQALAEDARRVIRRRLLSGTALNLFELRQVKRHLGGRLGPDESQVYRKGLRKLGLRVGIGLGAIILIFSILLFELRTSYSIAFEPGLNSPTSRVVLKRGRSSLSSLYFVPATPRFGSIVSDTGFASSQVASELARRITEQNASGTYDKNQATPIPSWLRTILDSLGPVQRGISLVLLGDPSGVVALKQAFADPVLRREALEALAVVGRGRAGEDEILSAALNDSSPDVRRRGVEVAAAIDRRLGKGTHATILRTALADPSFAVRSAALGEGITLDPTTAASILAVALADRDLAFRRLAEKGILDLARRSPAAAASSVRHGLGSTDSQTRKTALSLLDRITSQSPKEATSALHRIASDDSASEETRMTVLAILRRSEESHAPLQAMLEKAVGPNASPRLRTAALPVYARLIDTPRVVELAAANSKGPAALRATGAALWGVVAMKDPEAAAKPLKAFLYDSSAEVREEAARAFGFLKREGPELTRKAVLDPNIDVQRAAIESAIRLAAHQPAVVAEDLGKAVALVRPSSRQYLVEALGQIGQSRPNAVLPPLARALKLGDTPTRTAAARAFCSIASYAPTSVALYLRVAARDNDREVRTEAAACLGRLISGDPKGAARLAAQLTLSDEMSVRAAAATSLGALAKEAKDIAIVPLIALLEDRERAVRVAAVEALFASSKANIPMERFQTELSKKLSVFFVQGEVEDRQLALRVAAKLSLVALLRQAARDNDETIRLEAIKTAATLNPPAMDILHMGAEDRDALVRAEAVRALALASKTDSAPILPVFEVMLRSGDPATRRAGALALGEVSGSPEKTTALLATVLNQRSVSVRTAATSAISRIAERAPAVATPLLEKALGDPAYDVRAAAIAGLGAVWAQKRSPAEIAEVLVNSEADSIRRLVALEALVLKTSHPADGQAARTHLETVAETGPPLARLAAQVGRVFLGGNREDLHAFLEKLYGG